jgi:hypothetical protein
MAKRNDAAAIAAQRAMTEMWSMMKILSARQDRIERIILDLTDAGIVKADHGGPVAELVAQHRELQRLNDKLASITPGPGGRA